jgi:hypothetical protein
LPDPHIGAHYYQAIVALRRLKSWIGDLAHGNAA